MDDYKKAIKEMGDLIEYGKKHRTGEEKMIELYEQYVQLCSGYIRSQDKLGTSLGEREVREVIKEHVLPSIEYLQFKKEQFENGKRLGASKWKKYKELYELNMALASLRSFKHFCLYIEEDFDRKIWQPTTNIFDGWFSYATQMVNDGTVTFIEKQLPTGYGKSVSDCFLIAWIFGRDINNDVIKVFGSKHNIPRCIDTIRQIMTSQRYANVFSYFKQFNCNAKLIFETLKTRDGGEIKIAGSKCPVNLLCVGKDTQISGTRAKFLFLDDITQAEDKDKVALHKQDIQKYNDVWFKRSYSMNNFYIVAGGTTYSFYDFLSYLKRQFNYEDSIRSKLNKYTRVARSSEIKKDSLAVFISVPKLDYDTDESTYPSEFPTEKAKKQRSEDYRTFMAMEQQRPLPPDNTPFYYSSLREYDSIPSVGVMGRSNSCTAVLDPKRRGADNVAMPIFFTANDIENQGEEAHYLYDFLYTNKPMKDAIPDICSKIIQHHITKLYAERNTEECIGMLIEEYLKKLGYTACVIEDVYNTEPKDKRIMNAEGDIKRKIIFPRFGMYSPMSDFGKALENVYTYSYVDRNKHDDAIDAIAMYAKKFITPTRTDIYGIPTTFNW